MLSSANSWHVEFTYSGMLLMKAMMRIGPSILRCGQAITRLRLCMTLIVALLVNITLFQICFLSMISWRGQVMSANGFAAFDYFPKQGSASKKKSTFAQNVKKHT